MRALADMFANAHTNRHTHTPPDTSHRHTQVHISLHTHTPYCNWVPVRWNAFRFLSHCNSVFLSFSISFPLLFLCLSSVSVSFYLSLTLSPSISTFSLYLSIFVSISLSLSLFLSILALSLPLALSISVSLHLSLSSLSLHLRLSSSLSSLSLPLSCLLSYYYFLVWITFNCFHIVNQQLQLHTSDWQSASNMPLWNLVLAKFRKCKKTSINFDDQ